MGGRPMADPHWKNARGSASRPPRAGDPLQDPRFAPFCDILDVSPSLEGQTTFKFDKTKTITTVSKRASQGARITLIRCRHFKKSPENQRKRAKNYADEARKGPGAPHQAASAMGGRTMADSHWKNARGSAGRPPRAGDPLQGPRYAPFCNILDVSPSLEGQTTFKF